MPRAKIVVPANIPLTREHLGGLQCPCGAEHPVVISPLCHPDHPVNVAYDKIDGVLIVTCATCNHLILNVAVASAYVGPMEN